MSDDSEDRDSQDLLDGDVEEVDDDNCSIDLDNLTCKYIL